MCAPVRSSSHSSSSDVRSTPSHRITLLFFLAIGLLGLATDGLDRKESAACFAMAFFIFLGRLARPAIRQVSEPLSLYETLTLTFSSEHSFGLRHAGRYEEALFQKNRGFRGDSLNLSLVREGVWNHFFSDDQVDENGRALSLRLQLWPERADSLLRTKIERLWSQSVKEFIQSCPLSSSAFLLIDYGVLQTPYDIKRYYGLGKMGVQKIAPQQIVAMIKPPSSSLEQEKLVDYYFDQLVGELNRCKR